MEAPTSATRAEPASPPPSWIDHWCGVLTHSHTYSGRPDHGGIVAPPESYHRLTAWARQWGIAAVGMGSPYTPKSASTFARYDELERHRYYAPGFNRAAVQDADEIRAMLEEANAISGGRPLFYLDNETPKGRYGHLWWVGYYADWPAWHDYDQPFDRWMLNATRAGEHHDEPMAYERRPYLEIVAAQRARGALGFWAHPTSWWRGEQGQFITNIASELPIHVMAEGFVDGLVVMGYHPYRPEYQALWFALLDRGYRVPGVAEMDCGLSDAGLEQRPGAMLTYLPRPAGPLSVHALVRGFAAGRMCASSGPLIDLEVDGAPMGTVVTTGPAVTHRVRITARPHPGQERLGRLELLGRGGEVLWQRASPDGPAGGTLEVQVPGLGQRGYLIARVFGPEADFVSPQRITQFAISNPVYLHPQGAGFTPPQTTALHLDIRPDSPFHGGQVRFEAMDGTLLDAGTARGTIDMPLPASARLTLVPPDAGTAPRRTEYLANANPGLQAAQRHLYRGRFLLDFPSLNAGELPPEAWRLDDFAAALRQVSLVY